MKFLIALKTSSLYDRLVHNVFLPAFGIILVYISFRKAWGWIILAAYLFYLFRKQFFLFKVMLFLIIIYGTIIALNFFRRPKIPSGPFEGEVYVQQVTSKNDYYKIILNLHGDKVLWVTEDPGFRSGMVLWVSGRLNSPEPAHVPYGYDEQKTLLYQQIRQKITISDYRVMQSGWSVQSLNEICNKYYEALFPQKSASYLKALVIGNKNDLDQGDMDKIGILGISHLFVVSGLHIGLLVLIVEKILTFLRIPEKRHPPIMITFLSLYLLATAFLVAVVRVFTGEMLKLVNKKWKLDYDSLDLLSINFLLVSLLMPLAPYQYGFILTYLTTFSITVARRIFSQYPNFFMQSLAISMVSFAITFPIIISISYRINFLSIIYNLFYIPLVSFVILPFSMIVTLLPFLAPLYELQITGFSNTLSLLSGITFLQISFPAPSALLYVGYYALLLLIFGCWEKKKMNLRYLGMLLALLLLHKNSYTFNLKDEIFFLDLKEGEATFIGQSFNRCNILIDTGEVGNGDLYRFLDAKGISTIDYLIISHGDTDHAGQARDILAKYSVHNLIYSAYDDSENIHDIVRQSAFERALALKAGDGIKCSDDISFDIISPEKKYLHINQNSLVMVGKVFGLRILFTGDIDAKVEQAIISTREISVDILKVAHHGSITSTSEAFLKKTRFKLAVIMSGSRNMFGFPSKTVVERLKTVSLLMTKDQYSIILQRNIFEDRFKIIEAEDNRIIIFSPLSGDT